MATRERALCPRVKVNPSPRERWDRLQATLLVAAIVAAGYVPLAWALVAWTVAP